MVEVKKRNSTILYYEEKDIAREFNEYFSSIAVELDGNIPTSNGSFTDYLPDSVSSSMYVRPVSPEECSEIISSLKNTKYGIDSVSVPMMKLVKRFICEPISNLINLSFSSGIFPENLKKATITPIYKKGAHNDVGNYRPVSVLPLMSKIFEKAMSHRLIDYVGKFSILSSSQFGFQRGKSTADAILSLTEELYKSFNEKKHNISIFIDLKKAFDTVNHSILLEKLYRYGIRGLPSNWFRSYLADRSHRVKIGSSFSNYEIVNIGIPQGSILGPVLFLLYVNDLVRVSDLFTYVLFADDTTLSASDSDYEALVNNINRELRKIGRWTIVNRLSLNLDKTYSMLFSNRKCGNDDIFLDNEVVSRERSVLFLGLTLDNRCCFDLHIDEICKKLSRSIGIMYKIRSCVTNDVLWNLYYSLLYPNILYCINVWGGTVDIYTNRLLLLQKRAVRIITGRDFLAHTDPLFHQTGILKIKDVYAYNCAIYAYKLNASNLLKFPSHDFGTRNMNLSIPAYQRLSKTQKSISYSAPYMWNQVPPHIKELPTIQSFKKIFKNYLVNKYRD